MKLRSLLRHLTTASVLWSASLASFAAPLAVIQEAPATSSNLQPAPVTAPTEPRTSPAPAEAAIALRQFDLPAGLAEETLLSFGRQAGVQVIFAPEAVVGLRTPPLRGMHPTTRALEQLLAGLPLRIVSDPASGAYAVTRSLPPSVTENVQHSVLPVAPAIPAGENAKTTNNMNRSFPRKFLTRLLSGLSALTVTSASAQEADSVVLDTYVVVARNVTRANNVLNAEVQNTLSSAASAIDYLQTLPGVYIVQGDPFGGDDYSTRIFLRGFQAPYLGFNLDGVPNGATNYGGGTKPNRFIDPENISTISVSQGTADISSPGGQALGGTFDFATIDPTPDSGVHTALTVGDHNLRRVFARYNTGSIGGHTRAYLSISDQSHHRWMSTGSEAGVAERFHLDAKSVTTLSENFKLTFRYSYDDIWEPNYDSVTLTDFALNPAWDGLTGEWTGRPNVDENYIKGWNTLRENHLASLNFNLKASDDLKFHFTPYWQHQSGTGGWLPPYLRMGWDASGTSVNKAPFAAGEARAYFKDASGNLLPVFQSGARTPGVTYYTASNRFDITTYRDAGGNPLTNPSSYVPVQSYRTSTYLFDRYGASLGGEWKINGLNTLRFGTWLESLDREPGRTWQRVIDTRISWDAEASPHWHDFLYKVITDTAMVYAQDTVTLGALSLDVGLRFYSVSQSYDDLFHVRSDRELKYDSDPLPNIGAVYRLGDRRGELFAGYSQNFKVIDDGVISGSEALSPSLAPETTDNYEFGYRLNRSTFSASISAYFVSFDDRVLRVQPRGSSGGLVYDLGTAGGYVNAGGLESRGVEAAVFAKLDDHFTVQGGLTVNKSEYTEDILQNGITAGKKVVGSPELMITGGFTYTKGGYTASLLGKHVGQTYGTLDNSEKIDAFTTLDATLGYRLKLPASAALSAISVALRVSNLFDESYLSGPENETRTGGSQKGLYFVGAPRTVSLSISADF